MTVAGNDPLSSPTAPLFKQKSLSESQPLLTVRCSTCPFGVFLNSGGSRDQARFNRLLPQLYKPLSECLPLSLTHRSGLPTTKAHRAFQLYAAVLCHQTCVGIGF